MAHLTLHALSRARAAYNLLDGRRIRTDEEAARFVDLRGFCLLMPLDNVPLPSLSAADEGNPWGDNFRCTDRAWAWKETLPAQKLCAYSRLIRSRGTFIGWRLFPAFVAAYGPAGDIEEEYEAGRLARADRLLLEIVVAHGPLDSRDLWRRAKTIFGGRRHHFTAALDRLQARFFLTVAGGSLEGWSRHTWDLVECQAPPGILDRLPPAMEARRAILRQALDNCVALPLRQLRMLLGWAQSDFQHVLDAALVAGEVAAVVVEGEKIPWVFPQTCSRP